MFSPGGWFMRRDPNSNSINTGTRDYEHVTASIYISTTAFNEVVIEEREQGIQEIQNQIGEVNEIFKDLAVLVHEQGAIIGIGKPPRKMEAASYVL
ncbi:hypothetical protein SSX86_031186 [Deinandra increscens subsp. villosa]|uniref:t-SNARE coiled-coil homology domain-containing protein n=1 Tax=Deinandra increscens subsp. villosa TaxID=3103831 RepID=A0AAP0GJ79_9ASTR